MFSPDSIKISANIHADPATVFKVITDFSNYPLWNPWIWRVTTHPDKVDEFIATHGAFGKAKHRLTAITPPERVCWNLSGWQRFLVQAQREMLVYPVAGNGSLVTLKIALEGPAIPILKLLMKPRLRKRIAAEIKALKTYAEQISATHNAR